jgi:hypothetical protein
LWRFLRRRRRIFGAQEKGWVLSPWAGETPYSFSIDEFSFPKKWSVALLLSLSLSPTWVGSVDDCKVELVSFSSVGAVMDLVFLALEVFRIPSESQNCQFWVFFLGTK